VSVLPSRSQLRASVRGPAGPAWATVGVAAATGVLVDSGARGVVLLVAALAGVGLVVIGQRIVEVFLVSLFWLLALFMFLGRGITHVPVGPVYIGDLVLLLSVPTLVLTAARARFGAVHLLILAFMLWGAARTIPYLGQYGLDALRDGVIWGYALFALAVSTAVQPAHVRRVISGFRRLIPPFLVWAPISAVLTLRFGQALPRVPGSDLPVIDFNPGDIGVHMGAVAAFVLVGLYAWQRRAALAELLVWPVWIVSVAIGSAISRGGMLATSTAAVATLVFVRPAVRWLTVGGVVLALVAAGLLFNPVVQLGNYRQVSVSQFASNLTAIFSTNASVAGVGTKDWRLAWWEKIVGYTIDGPYFWTGKGYGINLANDDGFQVLAGNALRAPHSIHFDILARSGVPGLALWMLLQAGFAIAMLRAAARAARARRGWLLAVIAWTVAYWAANLVAGSFDVYIEGPQGGVVFWSLIGFGLVLGRLAAEPDGVSEATPAARSTAVADPVPIVRPAGAPATP
jgi:hypothetical protein